jgi:hypothetical protein
MPARLSRRPWRPPFRPGWFHISCRSGQPSPLIGSPSLVIPLFQQTKRFAHDLARRLVQPSTDLFVHQLLELGRQRDVHDWIAELIFTLARNGYKCQKLTSRDVSHMARLPPRDANVTAPSQRLDTL